MSRVYIQQTPLLNSGYNISSSQTGFDMFKTYNGYWSVVNIHMMLGFMPNGCCNVQLQSFLFGLHKPFTWVYEYVNYISGIVIHKAVNLKLFQFLEWKATIASIITMVPVHMYNCAEVDLGGNILCMVMCPVLKSWPVTSSNLGLLDNRE